MSNDIAIRIEGLGKRYRYGGAAPIGDTLRSDLTEWVRGFLPGKKQKLNHGSRSEAETASSPTTENTETHEVSIVSASSVKSAVKDSASSSSSVPSVVKTSSHPSFHAVHERHLNESPDYFWALRDINLEVRQGEVVGITGRNGAGKSLGQSV